MITLEDAPERFADFPKLPEGFRLLGGEILLLPKEELNDRSFPDVCATDYNVIEESLAFLAKVDDISEVGSKEPLDASCIMITSTANKGEVSKDLNKYAALFGRDSLYNAGFLAEHFPELLRKTLLRNAEKQGVTNLSADDMQELYSEEQRGKNIHESREPDDKQGQEITKNANWAWPSYGSIDSTGLFVRGMHQYVTAKDSHADFLNTVYEDRAGETQTMFVALERSVEWLEKQLGDDPEKLIEFKAGFDTAIENQVWKDSYDSLSHEDGTLANHEKGIAALEVQVTAYDALLEAAELYEIQIEHIGKQLSELDDSEANKALYNELLERGQHLQRKTEYLKNRTVSLKTAIDKYFWVDDEVKGGYFAPAVDYDDDGNRRTLKTRTSNMGHVLNSRLLDKNDADDTNKIDAVALQMRSTELLNVSGIRTLASDEVRFRAGAYHNGSVWLWDTFYIAEGLAKQGYQEQADDLYNRIINVIEQTNMFPEYVRGDDGDIPSVNRQVIDVYDTKEKKRNRVEQPPQEVQAWTVAIVYVIKHRLEEHRLLSAIQATLGTRASAAVL